MFDNPLFKARSYPVPRVAVFFVVTIIKSEGGNAVGCRAGIRGRGACRSR